ncbi:hypothetical protein KDL01_39705 [Actinospica durhamensis]|uniref:Uncharacterized protein n=1 Tax=Actinospica durhamensis TaxID=1508375 RepID=A0A941EY12_9ACTN|nr:hypothetical protein [Actinospica durhamensis]MBR7839453.1 hypothetical protein [Actinospica durhamensis]
MRDSDPELDKLARSLNADEQAAISLLDLQRLKVEQSRINPASSVQQTEPSYGVFGCLRHWQLLVNRMATAWPDADYYMVYEYLNDLTVRDQVEEYLDAMPEPLAEKIHRFVKYVDDTFADLTIHDDGAELSQYWRPLAEGREVRWWWLRTPRTLPRGW